MVGQYWWQGLNVGLAVHPSWVYRRVYPSLGRPLRGVAAEAHPPLRAGGCRKPNGPGGDLAATLGGLALFGHSRAKCPALPHRKQAAAGPTRPCPGRSGERGGRGPNCSIMNPSSRANICCKALLVAHSPTAGLGGVLGRGTLSVSSPRVICRKETVREPWIAL